MKHVIMYSGGVASWATAYKLSQEVNEPITLLFADTLIEDDDLYRFLYEGAAAIPNSELVIVQDGRTPWDVYRDVRYINHRAANCSKELKQIPCRQWIEANCEPSKTTLYVGIDWSESDRMAGIEKGWQPYTVKAPLMEGDWWDRQRCMEALKSLSIQPPRLYGLGFIHNNCGGFCCRMGKKQAGQLLEHFPDRFQYHADQEQAFREALGRDDVGILREQKHGAKRIISLADFALRSQAQETSKQLDIFESATCGCFGGEK